MYLSLTNGPAQTKALIHAGWAPGPDQSHPFGAPSTAPDALTFTLSQDRPAGPVLACHALNVPPGPAILRLDEVCFPVSAIAHRHTHSGPGLRYLARGALRIEAADHATDMAPGDSWFEPARTPVRAVATQANGLTSFVRCMILPPADLGRSTFALVDPADAALPRLQSTHRHLDLPFQCDAG